MLVKSSTKIFGWYWGSSMSMRSSYEAIVIGSGFGGSVAACRLAQAGRSVVVLERGRRYDTDTTPFPRNWNNPTEGWLWPVGQGLFDLKHFADDGD
jgi:cholesterol oxidase